MRTWTKSACVVLAWSILSITLMAVGMKGSVHSAQANTRTASSTEVILTRTLTVTAPSQAATPSETATPSKKSAPSQTATTPAPTYVVQYGDTLSGIAARFHIRGGWPPLYTSNLKAIGWNPNVIRPGTVLVIPGPAPVRYTVAAGDTLSGIAAALSVHGGWPALYAANRHAIGPDPNTLQPGTVLKVPHQAATAPPTPGVAPRQHPAPPSPSSSPPASVRPHAQPGTNAAPATTGMPQWLKTMLLAVGLLILLALLTEPVLMGRRRRRQAAVAALETGAVAALETGAASQARSGRELGPPPPVAERACIVLADHDRLVVTCNKSDDTVFVLRPPGEDPIAILRVARLVLREGPYGELAKQLGMPAIGSVD
jgi:LysM repeat protein